MDVKTKLGKFKKDLLYTSFGTALTVKYFGMTVLSKKKKNALYVSKYHFHTSRFSGQNPLFLHIK